MKDVASPSVAQRLSKTLLSVAEIRALTDHSIVAVHGLNSDAIHAWTFEGKTMWLEDLLPEQLPNARIMTYGYNSKVYRDATSGRLQDHAKGLLYALDSVRADKKVLPVHTVKLLHANKFAGQKATDHLPLS